MPSSSAVSSLPASSIPQHKKYQNRQSPGRHKKVPRRLLKTKKFFVGNRILPIPELVEIAQLKIISFIITDLKTRRLAGIKKETFEELLKTAGIPARYFCRRSFATWDVLLPTEDLAKKLAGNDISSKYYRLQPEYKSHQKIRVTVFNVLIQLNGDVLAAYLRKYGDIEEIITFKSSSGTAHGDYVVTTSLDRKGFQAIPQTLEYEEQTMMVVVEGRKPQCWCCKQLGHFSRSCPQKTTITTVTPPTTMTTTKTTTTTTMTPPTKENPQLEARDHPDKEEEGWTQVKKKKSPPKTTEDPPTNTATSKLTKKATKITTENATATTATEKPLSSLSSSPTKPITIDKEKSSLLTKRKKRRKQCRGKNGHFSQLQMKKG